MWKMLRDVRVALVASGLVFQMPLVWAQPLEVANPAETSREVATQVDQLVAEVAARDPELAQEIERQQQICLRDLSDGRLDDAGLTNEIETYREVQGEIQGRVIQAEVEARVADLTARGNTELAERMQSAFEAFRLGGGEVGLGAPELGGRVGGTEGEMISRGDARTMFEQAYQEVQRLDPEGAQQMKEMFESAERGEFVRPTAETMERMQQEMERYIGERPEMAEYCREYAQAEFERYAEFGGDHERFGPTDSPEQAREAFERWSAEGGGNSPAEMEHYREMMEHGTEMAHEYERMATEYERVAIERDYGSILDIHLDTNPPPPTDGGGGGGGTPHVEVSPGQWDGPDTDVMPDHTHPAGTAPHS